MKAHEMGNNESIRAAPKKGSRDRLGSMTKLKVGDPAPNFQLQDQNGNEVSLDSLRGKKVLLYFYPKADTPGCTKQSCHVRDLAPQAGDAVLLGISPDKPEKQKRFDEKYSLGFPLLCDEDLAAAQAYGVWREKTNFGVKAFGIVRSAFYVREDGTLGGVWYRISPDDTPVRFLDVLKGA